MPSKSSLINTFSSSWFIPSTLLGTRHMKDFGKGMVDKAEGDALYCRSRNTETVSHTDIHI